MATRKRQLSGDAEKGPPKVPVPFDLDEAIVGARVALADGLLEYLNSRLQHFGGKRPLPEDFSDGLLISVLKLIAPDGKYPMERGRFWQILDRYDPFSPWRPDGAMRTRLATEIEGLFAVAENESFDDGFDSVLSLELQRLMLRHGETTVEIVSEMIFGGRATPDVAAEALRSAGEMRNEATHEARRQLLERALASPSNITRDGAVVALAHLGDPRTIPTLEAAAAREDYRLLRANMLDLLEQLRGRRQ
jgi:hypothetical protein